MFAATQRHAAMKVDRMYGDVVFRYSHRAAPHHRSPPEASATDAGLAMITTPATLQRRMSPLKRHTSANATADAMHARPHEERTNPPSATQPPPNHRAA